MPFGHVACAARGSRSRLELAQVTNHCLTLDAQREKSSRPWHVFHESPCLGRRWLGGGSANYGHQSLRRLETKLGAASLGRREVWISANDKLQLLLRPQEKEVR